jgi:3',5'-cyclic-nucleotide phosphodiesterase
MWYLIIQLILAIDMLHHFNLVKLATHYVSENNFDINDSDMRLLLLKLLIKIADISNISHPFEVAYKWCNILNVEFFRQRDHEIEQRIGIAFPLNDRKNSNKPKSQIEFYNFICIPLHSMLQMIFPGLSVNLANVQKNLEK